MLRSSFTTNLIEAGCDEAGRGCLAGPVFAAAVILPAQFKNKLLNDSKQLTEKERNLLRPVIEREAVSFAVAFAEAAEIDHLNILKASILAMHRALQSLSLSPQLILVDGNRFYTYRRIPHRCIIKGDARFASIAAASVLAKTYRDDYMNRLHAQFPDYNWKKNKGYPTIEHRAALAHWGTSPHHRVSFRLFAAASQPALF